MRRPRQVRQAARWSPWDVRAHIGTHWMCRRRLKSTSACMGRVAEAALPDGTPGPRQVRLRPVVPTAAEAALPDGTPGPRPVHLVLVRVAGAALPGGTRRPHFKHLLRASSAQAGSPCAFSSRAMSRPASGVQCRPASAAFSAVFGGDSRRFCPFRFLPRVVCQTSSFLQFTTPVSTEAANSSLTFPSPRVS